MLDFTSALYLGMRHASAELGPWAQLTTGWPAALGEPPGAARVARRLAGLQGFSAGVLGTSTLHLLWDLFGMLNPAQTAVFLDAGTYAVARWGCERARARGVRIVVFPHHDTAALARLVEREPLVPLVVADGFCTGCGRPAPLRTYLAVARERGGQLLVDDTQALGLLGAAPQAATPYGIGGSGTTTHLGLRGPRLLVVCSLAKGFGAPVAILSGDARTVGAFTSRSETRVHCSPPSQAAISAAWLALERNADEGDLLRARLWRLVYRLQRRLAAGGVGTEGGVFPMQSLAHIAGIEPRALHIALKRLGMRTVLRRAHSGRGARVSLLLTTAHTAAQIDRAASLVHLAVAQQWQTNVGKIGEHNE